MPFVMQPTRVTHRWPSESTSKSLLIIIAFLSTKESKIKRSVVILVPVMIIRWSFNWLVDKVPSKNYTNEEKLNRSNTNKKVFRFALLLFYKRNKKYLPSASETLKFPYGCVFGNEYLRKLF